VISRFDMTADVRREDAMYHDYPIEQVARSTNTRFQMGFARMTMHLLPEFDDIVLEPSLDGLKILAAHETALSRPGELIRRMYADSVEFEEPQVRLLYGESVQEPVMWVRASIDREHAEHVIQDLITRGGEIEQVDWMALPLLVLARAPLRELLGYPRALGALTQGRGEVRMWLSHYAPVPPPEPGKAA